MAVAIGAIAGGAVGNVIDRVRFGGVVDFIHAHVGTPWGLFLVCVQCRRRCDRLRGWGVDFGVSVSGRGKAGAAGGGGGLGLIGVSKAAWWDFSCYLDV